MNIDLPHDYEERLKFISKEIGSTVEEVVIDALKHTYVMPGHNDYFADGELPF